MEAILDWGIEVVLWFQQFSPALDLPFKLFTFMGEEEFFLLLLPLLYWCLDRHTGARLVVLFLFSSYVNAVAKNLGAQPRPTDYAPDRVLPLWEQGGYGFPSNHTQSAVIVWGYLAAQFRRTWLWVVAGLLMVFIPLSRVYLGVHFPTDLLGGYVLGALLLLLYLRLEPGVERWFEQRGTAWELAAALALPVLPCILLPIRDEQTITACATLAGLSGGLVLERRWIGFESRGAWWKLILRFVLGAAGLLVLRVGLGAVFSGLEPVLLFRFFRYALIGLWGGLGAPWAFVRLRLAEGRRAARQ